MLGSLIHKTSPKLHSILVDIKRGEFEFFPPRFTYAEPDIHRILKRIFSNTSGFFIEAGANNGVSRSNTYYLERHYGWTGLLIEAIPHRFVECTRNRPKSKSVHCALVSPSYEKPSVELTYMDLMSMVNAGGAIDFSGHMQQFQNTKRHRDVLTGTKFHAPARTLGSVLQDLGNPEVDFFSLDVEGLEHDVLLGLDFETCSPRRILVEDWDKSGIHSLLTSKGYEVELRFGEKDALFKLKQS